MKVISVIIGPTTGERLVLFRIDRHSPGEPTPWLRSNSVALGNVVEYEAGAADQGHGVTGEVAAIRDPALEGF